MDLMPWILLVPGGVLLFAGSQRSRSAGHGVARNSECDQTCPGYLKAVVVGGAVMFFCLLLVPGVLPRYVLPLGLPFAVVAAFALQSNAVSSRSLQGWFYVNRGLAVLMLLAAVSCPVLACIPTGARSLDQAMRELELPVVLKAVLASSLCCALAAWVIARRSIGLKPMTLLLASAALAAGASLLYATAAIRWINSADDLRPQAAAINQMVPIGAELLLYDPGYWPTVFYLRKPYRYALSLDEIPADASYLVARPAGARKISKALPEWSVLETFSRKGKPEILILRRSR